MKIILLLGSPNDNEGRLSAMALSRIKVCQKLHKEGWDKIVLTGGFGEHFNTTSKPHAFYLRKQLLGMGIPLTDIIAMVESANSVEDATLSKWIIEDFKPVEIAIVTSDYHSRRAKLIFDAVYAPFDKFQVFEAPSHTIDPLILNPLKEHESRAVKDLLQNGVRF